MQTATTQQQNSGTRVTLAELLKWRAYAQHCLLPQRQRHNQQRQPGQHTSRLRGRGVDFAEVRVYHPGDEIRNMDWRVTARTGTPHTKLYHQEREYTVYFVIDYRSSMWFGTRKQFKAIQAAHLAALFAWTASLQGHHVGGLIITNQHIETIAPHARQTGVLNILHALEQQQTANRHLPMKNSLENIALHLQHTLKPGNSICWISDFYDMDAAAQQHIQTLAHTHDVWINFMYDPIERELPPPNQYAFSNGEMITELNTSDRHVRQQYYDAFQARYNQLKHCCTTHGMTWNAVSTQDDLI